MKPIKLISTLVTRLTSACKPKVVEPTGDWRPYLPIYEPQFGGDWDTDGCSIWGSENMLETLLKKLTDKDYNFSERHVYIGTHTRPPGNDPVKIMEWIKVEGLIQNEILPMTETFEEFIEPDPLPPEIVTRARMFLQNHRISFEYRRGLKPELQRKYIKSRLKTSPIGVSLYAWHQDENGLYYRPPGARDTHWCVLVAEGDGFDWVFDSYDQNLKRVRHDMGYNLLMSCGLSLRD